MRRIAIILGVLFGLTSQLAADSSGALVVATCGTLPLAYSVGSTRALTIDTNGLVCV